jgi:phosphoribosylformylglycinamidine cyclo-ligase
MSVIPPREKHGALDSSSRMTDYREAGVDIDAGNEAVRRIRSLARGTFTSGVLSDIGSFGGLFRLDTARSRAPTASAPSSRSRS